MHTSCDISDEGRHHGTADKTAAMVYKKAHPNHHQKQARLAVQWYFLHGGDKVGGGGARKPARMMA